MVIWSEIERLDLIDKVAEMRLNYPSPTIVTLINRAQEQFPEERRREITTATMVPWLVDGVKSKLEELKTLQSTIQRKDAYIQKLEDSLTKQTDSLSLREAVGLVFDKIETRLVSIEARARVTTGSVPIQIQTTKVKRQPIRIAVLGCKGDQFLQLCKHFIGTDVLLLSAKVEHLPDADGAVITRFERHGCYERATMKYQIVFRSSGGLNSWVGCVKQVAQLTVEGKQGVYVADYH